MAKGLKSVFLWSALGLIGLMAGLFVAAVGVGYFSARGDLDPDGATVWILGAFVVLVMIGAFATGVVWMRSIDEAAQEAHKWSWYWGGSAGIALGGVALCLTSLPQAASLDIPTWLSGRTDPAAYAATGAFAMLLLMLVAYGLAWTVWWMRRR